MKKLAFACMRVLALSLLAVLCTAGTASAQKKLNLFIWSEYIDPEIISAFEKKFDCKVTMDLYEDNESLLAKLEAGGTSVYDIVVPSDYIVTTMIKKGLLAKLDADKIPNMRNIEPRF